MNRIADIIHVGFPKTGTTWLQEQLKFLEGVASIGKGPIDQRYRELIDQIIKCDSLDFDAPAFSSEYERLHKENHEKIANKVTLLSHELLSGELYAGKNCGELAHRLKAVFGNSKIILVIREQASMIESLYKYYVRSGGPLSLRDFYWRGEGSPCMDVFGTKSVEKKFRYDRVIKKYHALFGKENVLVLPYEMLKEDSNTFVNEILAFGGVQTSSPKLNSAASNTSLSIWGVSLLRILNLFIRTPFSSSPSPFPREYAKVTKAFRLLDKSFLRKLPPRKPFVDHTVRLPLVKTVRKLFTLSSPDDCLTFRELIEEAYTESNKETAKLINYDLKKYGYS